MGEKRHPIRVKYDLKVDGRYTIKDRLVYVDHTRHPKPGERALMLYHTGGRGGLYTIVGEFIKIDGRGCSVVITDYGHKFRQKTESIWPIVEEEPEINDH